MKDELGGEEKEEGQASNFYYFSQEEKVVHNPSSAYETERKNISEPEDVLNHRHILSESEETKQHNEVSEEFPSDTEIEREDLKYQRGFTIDSKQVYEQLPEIGNREVHTESPLTYKTNSSKKHFHSQKKNTIVFDLQTHQMSPKKPKKTAMFNEKFHKDSFDLQGELETQAQLMTAIEVGSPLEKMRKGYEESAKIRLSETDEKFFERIANELKQKEDEHVPL